MRYAKLSQLQADETHSENVGKSRRWKVKRENRNEPGTIRFHDEEKYSQCNICIQNDTRKISSGTDRAKLYINDL